MDYSLVSQGLKWGGNSYGTSGGVIQWSPWTTNFGGEAFVFNQTLSAAMTAEINQAMRAWEAVANIRFQQTSDNASLNTTGLRIGLGAGDGAGGTEGLARRYTPSSDNITKAAQIWLDSGEGWHTVNGRVVDSGGNSFYQVVLHEIGHVLGLAHYDGGLSVMNTAVNNLTQLQAGDIAGIQYIYGSNTASPDLVSNIRNVEADARTGATKLMPGELMLVHYSLTNQSTTTATEAKAVGFYLSTDATIDSSDLSLGSLTLSDNIATLTQLDVATYVRIPTNLAPGTYYVGIEADQTKQIAESNEGNNFSQGFVVTIGNGVQALTHDEVVSFARLYNAGFGRDFDTAGLNYWIDMAEGGQALGQIALNFLYSQEFTQRYGSVATMSNSTFIDVMYQNVLHRAGEAAGVSYWIGRLDQGLSKETTLQSFAASAENIDATQKLEAIREVSSGYWDLV